MISSPKFTFFYFIIAKKLKLTIIKLLFGVSSNGRTRDFGSLYHGSNPCAPTKNSTGSAGLIFGLRTDRCEH